MLTRLFLLSTTVASLHAAPASLTKPGNTFLTSVRGIVPSEDSTRLAAAMARAERLEASGRQADARRAYRDAISAELEAGDYPAEAMWRLANAYFADDNEVAAARELDRLAEAAQNFGDPATELRARFEAAVLYARHENPAAAAAHLQRVRTLLKSPVIDERTRRSIASRIVP